MTSRSQRESPIKDDAILRQKGDAWMDSHKKHVPKDISKLSIIGSYERKY